jgi:1-acyl-sn-glycerol-3-phosphate acyltransferase
MRSSAVERSPEVERPYSAPAFEPLPLSALRGAERYTVALGEAINTRAGLKTFAATYSYAVPRNFVTWASRRRWRIYGMENMAKLRPQRGVILVSNHRSFFDMYIAAASIFVHGDFIERLYFPVRANFFYDNPLGALVNFMMSGYAMWPPMFRDDRKTDLNPIGLRQMSYALSAPGAVLGIHPEGARQKGDDPYMLGAARPGVGRLVEQCDPDTIVLPFFILGPSNDLAREISLRFRSAPGHDIRMHWGTPLRCGDLRERSTGAQDLADALLQIVHDLGQQDRAIVARSAGPQ